MTRQEIPLNRFCFDGLILRDKWMLLTAGDDTRRDDAPRGFNSMTISWGSAGQIWDKVFFQVVVRPHRYTYEFMEKSDTFGLCVFPAEFRKALSLLGSLSGREVDKIGQSGLTPIPGVRIPTPGYDEAELIVECRKMYWHDIDPSHFLDPKIDGNYPERDYHRAYFGEVLRVSGTTDYIKPAREVAHG